MPCALSIKIEPDSRELDPGIHRNKAAGESPPFFFKRISIL
jgi:hypothetical protein